jgi:hypothetical protein
VHVLRLSQLGSAFIVVAVKLFFVMSTFDVRMWPTEQRTQTSGEMGF